MIGTIATATRAAAPFVGSAVVTGSKALAGFAVASKIGGWASNQAHEAKTNLTLAVGAAREEAREQTPNNVTPAQERKVAS